MATKRTAKNIRVFFYLLPTFTFLFMFTYYPYIKSFIDSLFLRRGQVASFVGLQNYIDIFSDPLFYTVIGNNLVYTCFTVPVTVLGAFFLAVLLNRPIYGASIFKTAFFYPTVIPMAAASMIWLYILLPNYGIVNRLLVQFGFHSVEWVGQTHTAMFSIMMVGIWKNVGYYMMIFLTGLQIIPKSLIESAYLDGAGVFVKFRKIILPMMSSTSFFIVIIAVINSFQAVEQVYLMTRGGPGNATNLMVYYIYQNAFSFWNFNTASTLTVLLVSLLLIITLAFFKFIEPRVYYESGDAKNA